MLIIPASLWETATTVLREPPHDRERVAYLDGPPGHADARVATTITVPHAEQRAGHFQVTSAEMSRAGLHLRALGLVRHAQIHSHPDGWAGHSGYDDEHAFSQRDGAISIVVPHYAGCAPGIADCGIHVRDEDGWKELDNAQAAAAVMIVPSLVDLRS